MSLDDRLYRLQRSNIPEDLRARLILADASFLKDNELLAEKVVTAIEEECRHRGVSLYDDQYMAD